MQARTTIIKTVRREVIMEAAEEMNGDLAVGIDTTQSKAKIVDEISGHLHLLATSDSFSDSSVQLFKKMGWEESAAPVANNTDWYGFSKIEDMEIQSEIIKPAPKSARKTTMNTTKMVRTNGEIWNCVIIPDCYGTDLRLYKELYLEAKKDFPELTESDCRCLRVTNSIRFEGSAMLHFQIKVNSLVPEGYHQAEWIEEMSNGSLI